MVRSRDGVEIAYDVHDPGDVGAGAPTVVLVHGWAGSRAQWQHQVGPLAERYRVVTLDLGGHGESGLGRSDWTLTAFGDDVVAVVDHLGTERVALVGHSMGGDAVTYAALSLEARVAGLVWIDTFRSLGDEPVSPPEAADAVVAPFVDDFETATDAFVRGMFPTTADPDLVDRIASSVAAAPRDAALGSMRYVLNRQPPIIAALAEITAPVVAINPDVAPTDADSLHRHGVLSIVLDDVGHYLMIEDPDQLEPVLASTLASFFARPDGP